MAATLITIQEAASISGKSIQTIRRAIKSKKLVARKKKTPQGYNYTVNQDSVYKYYKIKADFGGRKSGGIKQTKIEERLAEEFATLADLKRIQKDMDELITEHKKAKDSFVRFMKAFQEKFAVMENQMKLLEEPDEKRWYQFWK